MRRIPAWFDDDYDEETFPRAEQPVGWSDERYLDLVARIQQRQADRMNDTDVVQQPLEGQDMAQNGQITGLSRENSANRYPGEGPIVSGPQNGSNAGDREAM